MTRFRRRLAMACLATCTHLSALADPLEEAWAHYDQASFGKAADIFRALRPIPAQGLGALCEMAVENKAISSPEQDIRYCEEAAAANDPQGLVSWGQAHLSGHERLGVHDETLGLGYLARAVTAHYPVASEALCNAYAHSEQLSKAAPFCKVAAASNLPGGLLQLAQMSLTGKGAVQDFEKARKLALLSARLNNPSAYALLAHMDASGSSGTEPNLVRAYAWYSLAAAAAPDWEAVHGDRDQLNLDPAKIAAAQRAAGNWKRVPDIKWRHLYPDISKATP